MIRFKKNIIDDNNYAYGMYLSLLGIRISFEYNRKKQFTSSKQVIISPPRCPIFAKINCTNGLKMSVGYKNIKTLNSIHDKACNKKVYNKKEETKTMYKSYPIKIRKNALEKEGYSRCVYSTSFFPDQIKYTTRDLQHCFFNNYGSSDILHKFYFNLTKINMHYIHNKVENHKDYFKRDTYKIFEEQELLKISNNLNKKIVSRGHYLNINYKPHLIKLYVYNRELLQKKIFQAERLLKDWKTRPKNKKIKVKKLIPKKVSIRPSAPSYNPEFFKGKKQYKKPKFKKIISPKRSLISINNSFNMNIQCNIL